MHIDQHTELYGVTGFPLKHTLGPVMHNAAFFEAGLNAVYLAFETMHIAGCITGIRSLGIRGMSVTIPHKSSVIPLIDRVDSLAKDIGAVNTIVNRNNRLTGYNTDATGAIKALEKKVELPGKTCLVIGAGGAARAVAFMLKKRGVKITIVNRSAERGETLAGSLSCPFLPLKELKTAGADIIVQATSVGMFPREDECPVPEQALKGGMVVMDIIYNPLETKLLKAAKSRGCFTVNGLDMFVGQGAEQFRLWTGLEPPVDSMARAVKGILEKNRGIQNERD